MSMSMHSLISPVKLTADKMNSHFRTENNTGGIPRAGFQQVFATRVLQAQPCAERDWNSNETFKLNLLPKLIT